MAAIDNPIPVQETLAAWQQMSISLATLFVMGLGLVAVIVITLAYVQAKKRAPEVDAAAAKVESVTADTINSTVLVLTQIVNDYKTLRDEAEKKRDDEQAQHTESLTAITDVMNRMADMLDGLKKQQQYGNEADIKRDLLLEDLRKDMVGVAKETPLLDKLTAIEIAITELKCAIDGIKPVPESVTKQLEEIKALLTELRQETPEPKP